MAVSAGHHHIFSIAMEEILAVLRGIELEESRLNAFLEDVLAAATRPKRWCCLTLTQIWLKSGPTTQTSQC